MGQRVWGSGEARIHQGGGKGRGGERRSDPEGPNMRQAALPTAGPSKPKKLLCWEIAAADKRSAKNKLSYLYYDYWQCGD